MPSPRRSKTRRSATSIKKFNPQEFLANAGVGRIVRKYRPKAQIFSQGDPCEAVFYIQEGRVRLSVVSDQGKEATIAMLGPDEFLGEGSVATDQPVHLGSATAITGCSLLQITKLEMLRALHEEREFSELFVLHLLNRYKRTQEDLVDQLFNSSEKRLARALLTLANFGKNGAARDLNINVNQETLAGMIGTTRPRVNFFMNKFKRLGFIGYNGGLKVHDSLLSVVLND
jgi:CRP/FNR family transcriptional regulator, cyclic AMP receptor protein